ncbi:MAG: efflux RND transporter permease subunit [Burkholderiaceae bacterium]
MRDQRVERVGGQQPTLSIDRQAIARAGLNASDVHDVIEMAIGGKVATEIYEGERRFQAIVCLPESVRDSVDDIRRSR